MSHAGWLRNFSRDLLVSREIVSRADDDVTVIEKLLRFFGVNDPSAFDRVFLAPQAKYKRSTAYEIDRYNTAVWLRLATGEATRIASRAPEYSAALLRQLANDLRKATTRPIAAGFREMQARLFQAGVVLVFVPEIERTRISGVSLWLASDRPMIALTNRYKFEDSFWFSLAHEIGHVLLHLKRTTFVEDHSEYATENIHHGSDNSDEHERAANKFAEQLFLGQEGPKRLEDLHTPQQVSAFAKGRGIDPGIVAGQYGNATGNWSKFGRLRKRADLQALLHAPIAQDPSN